jgi:hypothetical protein
MDSLTNKFKEALALLDTPSGDHHVGDKQLFYVTFDPSDIQQVKKLLPDWINLSVGAGYQAEVLSIGEVLNTFFKENPNRESWTEFDQATEKWELEDLFQDLGDIVKNNHVIEKAILDKQEALSEQPNALLIITDLETLHPFSRFGPIEQSIYNKLEIPIIILYPGKKTGSALKFLGFYPEDGNYRSKHI